MSRKGLVIALGVVVLIMALATFLASLHLRPKISCVSLTDTETAIASALRASHTSRYELTGKLPADTVVTHWVEHYVKGERMADLADYSVRTREAVANPFMLLVASEDEVERERWSFTVFGHAKYSWIPKPFFTTASWQSKSQVVKYGVPMTLMILVRGEDGTSGPTSDMPLEEQLEELLQNDHVYVLKVQIDKPK